MGYLALLFVVLPLLDLALLLLIGDVLGFLPTVGLTVAVAVLGAYLGKREGLRVLSEWQRAMGELRMPEEGLISGALVLAGAVLLVSPGVLTDAVGLAFLFPPTRRVLARILGARIAARLARAAERGQLQVRVVSTVHPRPDERGGLRDVLDTEVEVVEPARPLLGP